MDERKVGFLCLIFLDITFAFCTSAGFLRNEKLNVIISIVTSALHTKLFVAVAQSIAALARLFSVISYVTNGILKQLLHAILCLAV